MRFLFLILGLLFFGIWIVSFLAFHIAGFAIHILLIVGVIALIIHFARGSSTV